MSVSTYKTIATQASERERLKEWEEAKELWQKAYTCSHPGSENKKWAWARAEYCNFKYLQQHSTRSIFLNHA